MVELAKLKRSAQGQVDARERDAAAALGACSSGGPGWKRIRRYVSKRQAAAARAHWGSRDQSALDAARDRLKALGGDEGYANYFAFAFKG